MIGNQQLADAELALASAIAFTSLHDSERVRCFAHTAMSAANELVLDEGMDGSIRKAAYEVSQTASRMVRENTPARSRRARAIA